jgi:hypothetical protein
MVNDHFYSAPLDAMLSALATFGSSDFVDSFISGVDCDSMMSSGRVPSFYLSQYFEFRCKENLPLTQDEAGLFDFFISFCPYDNLCSVAPPSDLPIDFPVIFCPERVARIAAQTRELNIDNALEYYECVWHGGEVWYFGNWTRIRMADYLAEVVAFWAAAAAKGHALFHTQF